jgi:hypothetical protein
MNKKTQSKKQELDILLDKVNPLIKPLQLAYISPKQDCDILAKNARYMDKETFNRLTNNIKEDGFLSQLPFAMKKSDGKYLILSGNHRIKAAIKAKLEFVLIIFVDEISKDKQIAYQLSHNKLIGKNHRQILKDVFAEIDKIDMKEFSGYSGVEFLEVTKLNLPSINEDDIELQELKLIFVSSKKKSVEAIFDKLEKIPIDENSKFVLVDFREFIRVMTEIKKRTKIKSLTVGVIKMLEICEEYLNQTTTK